MYASILGKIIIMIIISVLPLLFEGNLRRLLLLLSLVSLDFTCLFVS